MCMSLGKAEEGIGFPGTGVSGGFKLPEGGVGNRAQVLCITDHLYQALLSAEPSFSLALDPK